MSPRDSVRAAASANFCSLIRFGRYPDTPVQVDRRALPLCFGRLLTSSRASTFREQPTLYQQPVYSPTSRFTTTPHRTTLCFFSNVIRTTLRAVRRVGRLSSLSFRAGLFNATLNFHATISFVPIEPGECRRLDNIEGIISTLQGLCIGTRAHYGSTTGECDRTAAPTSAISTSRIAIDQQPHQWLATSAAIVSRPAVRHGLHTRLRDVAATAE